MARPVSMKRRQELALAAFEAIRVRGVYGITMSELAETLGMKRPTLYWYFRDVGHVFETVLEHMLERQSVFLAERLRGVAHPVDLLRVYADSIWAFFEQEGPNLLALVSFWGHSEAGEPTRVLEVTNRHFLPLVSFAVSQLEDGIRRGTVAPCNPRAVVDLVSSVIDGSLVHRVSRGIPFGPVGELLWTAVLAPLKRTAAGEPGQAAAAGPTPDPGDAEETTR